MVHKQNKNYTSFTPYPLKFFLWILLYSDTSANEDNSFQNHIR